MFLIKKKKRKKSSVASAPSSVAFHGLITTEKQITAGSGSNTEPEKAKPVALFHHSHPIVDSISSPQSSPDIFHRKTASNNRC